MKKRSWGWRLAAIAAGVALALGLVACGGDDDNNAADTATTGGGGPTLNLAYVTTATHPYGLAVADFAKKVDATGELTITTQASYPQAEPQLLADVRSGVVDMATISSAIWDTAGIDAFQALQAPFLITNYPLAPGGRGRRHRQGDDRRRAPRRPATWWCWRSTRAGCASPSAR